MTLITIEEQVEQCRKDYEAGRYDALILAFLYCTENSRPLPAWLAKNVLGILEYDYRMRRVGALKTPTGAAIDTSDDIHQQRIRAVDMFMGIERVSKAKAAQMASDFLKGRAERGSPQAILKSYREHKKS